jgi:predicted nucleotidyltransferase
MSSLKDILSSFHLQDELNPKIWSKDGQKMNPKVRERLLEITNDFIEFLGVDVIVTDVIMTGSLANYNWSKFSDIDLHIVANFSQFSEEQLPLYEELFKLKKTLYNDKHNIKIFGYDVELYVQNETEIHFSSGVYSVLFDEWSNKPEKETVKIDKELIKTKSQQWMDIIDSVIENASDEPIESAKKIIKKYKDKLKKYRTCGLEKDGEYSDENLVFKVLRRNGYIEKLFNFEDKHIDKQLSLKEQAESDEYSNIVDSLTELSNKNLTLINEPKPKGQKIFNPNTEILQTALTLMGYPLPKFGVDGKFGFETQKAVEAFEKDNGLTIDGKMDPKDFKKMSDVVFKRKATKTIMPIKPKETELTVKKEKPVIKPSGSVDFRQITRSVINNLEGGYYNPNWNSTKGMGRSGETMFGIDRRHGGKYNTSPAGIKFWSIIDKNKTPQTWKYNYRGGQLEGELTDLVVDIIQPFYNEFKDRYLSPTVKKLVDSDSRLTFHFAYAVWNGPGWFRKFAKVINKAVENGELNTDVLSKKAIRSRVDSGNSLIAKSGRKIDDVLGINAA